jgi:hypothetical protein
VSRRRVLRSILIAAAALVFAAAAAAAFVIGPRNIIGMLRYDERKTGALKPGDPAPDVSLVSLDGTTPVALSSKLGTRPLVLVFGSFT